MSRQFGIVNVASFSFENWITRDNDIINLVNTDVVTTSTNTAGDLTVGNGYVIGIFGSNTLVATNIRGGNVKTSATLSVISNANFTGSQVNSSANVYLNPANIYFETANSTTIVGNTLFNSNTTNQVLTIISNSTNVNVSLSANTLYIAANIYASNTLNVTGAVSFANTLATVGNVNFSNTLTVSGNTVLSNNLTVAGYANVANTLATVGNVNFSNSLSIVGYTNVANTLTVTGNVNFSNTLTVTGNTLLSNTLNVTGNTILSNNLTVAGYTNVANTLTVTGNVNFSNTLTITGYANVANTLTVTGNANFSNSLTTTGYANVANTLTVTGNTTLINLRASYSNTDNSDITTILTVASNFTANTTATKSIAFVVNAIATTNGFIANSSTIVVGNSTSNTIITGNSISTYNIDIINSSYGANGYFKTLTGANLISNSISTNTISSNSISTGNVEIKGSTYGVNGYFNTLTGVSGNGIIFANTVNTYNLNITNSILGGGANGYYYQLTGNSITAYTISTYNMSVTGSLIGTFNPTGNFVPGTNNIYQIGTSSNVFLSTYSTTVIANAINSQSGLLTISGNVAINGSQLSTSGILSSTGSYNFSALTQVAIDTYSISTYRTGEYTLQFTDTSTSSYHVSKIMVYHDGTSAYSTEYSQMYNNSSLATITVDINGSNVRVLVTPATTTTTVKFNKTLLVV